ncbi:hypothetical protein ACIRS1_21750 [Kitasatospora sp. NPDC101176]|uniref:hypothetical protein n=1 Tax=Kitasatospora sp. NPDC101176 TaxID=3364099 RepID=UPI0037FE40B7
MDYFGTHLSDAHLFDDAPLPEDAPGTGAVGARTADWEPWLAYAQRLSDAGDPRGAAIRLEHRCGSAGGTDQDREQLAAAYREVERRLGLGALREDGSWRFTWSRGFLDEACFRLAGDTRAQRGELVGRLRSECPAPAAGPEGPDPADPEQWEGALIGALLAHPAARRLRVLELHLTDYHRSAEPAARAVAARPFPRLEHLYFGYGFEFLYEDGTASTGRRLDPLEHHDRGLVQTAMWGSLPALRTLELEGAFLFHSVDHDGLTRLRVRGPAVSDGSVFALGHLPELASLEVDFGCDVFGVGCPVEQLDELAAAPYPALRHLDLGRVEFDAPSIEVLSALADSPVLAGLESLALRELAVGGGDDLEDPRAALAELAPRFAHLTLRVDGPIAVEGTAEDVDRLLARFGLCRGAAAEDRGSAPGTGHTV